MHDYAVGDKPVAIRQLLRMAKDAGLRDRQVRLSWRSLLQLGEAYPVLAELENGNWVVIASAAVNGEQEMVRVLDPLAERPEVLLLTEQQLSRRWRGAVVLLKRSYRPSDDDQPFGWFVPGLSPCGFFATLQSRRSFSMRSARDADLFQLVIDKVLFWITRLAVLTIGIAVALVFDTAFLRRYLLLYATNKIDIRVATRFWTPLNLPIALFEQASAGVLKNTCSRRAHSRVLDRTPFSDASRRLVAFDVLPILVLYGSS